MCAEGGSHYGQCLEIGERRRGEHGGGSAPPYASILHSPSLFYPLVNAFECEKAADVRG